MTAFTDDQEVAFKTDLTRLIPQMRAFARGLCQDATYADDLAQDALAKAWTSRHSYQPGTNLKAWVFMILRNGFFSDKRRSWRSTQLDPAVAESTLIANTNPTAAIELNDVRRAMEMLPQDQREALVLIGAAGLSYEEAAVVCDTAVGTIKSRVSRARTRLQEILEHGELADDGVMPHAAMGEIFALAGRLRAAA